MSTPVPSTVGRRPRSARRHWLSPLVLAFVLLVVGCRWQSTPAPPPVPVAGAAGSSAAAQAADPASRESNASASASAADKSDSDDIISQTADVAADTSPAATDTKTDSSAGAASGDAANGASGATDSTGATSDAAGSEATPATTSRHRLLLMLPDGPIVADVLVSLDGRPLGESLFETLARILTEADADQDGRVTWDEITRQPAFQRGVYGNQPIAADNDRRQVIQRYDWNRDKTVSRDELLRWLVREPHRAKPVVVDSLVGASHDSSLGDSPLLKYLDTNRDGQLDEHELEAAPQLLLRRDADEDEILQRSDLILNARMPNDPAMSRPEGGGPAVILLGARQDWEYFQRTMQNAYSLGGPLGADAWPAAAPLFQALDSNGDGLIGRSEWAGLESVTPSLVLDLKLGGATDSLEMQDISPEFRPFVESGLPAGNVRLNLPRGKVELILTPSAIPDFTAQAQNVLTSFDADKNGYLDETEAAQAIAMAGGTFADVDQNDDGKLYADELAAALRRRQSIVVEQLRVQAGYREDAWWQVADENGDGRLDSREIDSIAARFRALDQNGDGIVTRDEVATTYVLGLSRGAANNQVVALPLVRLPAPAVGDLPAWFTHMDTNGDGQITRREFLGDYDLFQKLDRNGDGRLEWSELRE